MSGVRLERTLLLEQEQGGGLPPLRSIKDATGDHQLYALSQGYSSILELTVDELIALVLDLRARIETLEQAGP